ncbi:MAG: GTPase Era [Kiritimatiellae bacterium]|nr:GTPase Era [Kiritimatiellia bacterium]
MKSAVVAIVGRTNAGKSTLVNNLVGEKISIVSPVEQTTRNMVRGIVADPRGQLVLLDTPGLHKAVGNLGRLLNRIARRTSAGADILCVVFDASCAPQMEDAGWMARVASEKPQKVLFVLNKSDRKPFFESMYKDAWNEALSNADSGDGNAEGAPDPVWTTAASNMPGGADSVAAALFDMAEEGEPLFPEDIVTDYPRRFAIADSIREKFLARLHGEVPHELGIVVGKIDENGGEWKVSADVLVNRPSQKPIVVGRGAENVKYARKCAERELSSVFGVKIRLELWVKVEPLWMRNDRLLSAMGYLDAE